MISESEWLTRKKRIDARLTALGWKIIRHSEGIYLSSLDNVAVEELPTASGPADYALFGLRQITGDYRSQEGNGEPAKRP